MRYTSGNFKIRFKIQCIRDGYIPTALAIEEIVYLLSRSTISLTFETVALPVVVTGRPDLASLFSDSEICGNFHISYNFNILTPNSRDQPFVINGQRLTLLKFFVQLSESR